MSGGPSIEGRVLINTKSVQEAQRSVRNLEKNLESAFTGGTSVIRAFNKQLSQQDKEFRRVADGVRNYGVATQQLSEAQQRSQNMVARAANQVAQFEATVKRSNTTQQQQTALTTKAASILRGYSSVAGDANSSSQQLQNVNTQLTTSMGQLGRELQSAVAQQRQKEKADREAARAIRENEQATVRQQGALSQANATLQRVSSAIRTSSLESEQAARNTREVTQAHEQLTAVLGRTSSTTAQVATAQRQYREVVNRVTIATREANSQFRSAQAKKFAGEFRNLTSSVQVALGPLSGVASRLTALQGLFSRNAAALASMFAAVTVFTVGLSRAAAASQEAQRQMLQLDATIENLGDRANLTAGELQNLAVSISADTLLSASDVRSASAALLQFGGIARNQFEEVIKSAQGMATVLRGDVTSNVRLLGRAIEDPERGLTRLRSAGVTLTDAFEDQIKTLVAQGQRYKATSLLLERMNGLQAAGENESKSLAGAYDAVTDNLQNMFEQLFIGTGAIDEAEKGVRRVAAAINDFASSDDAAMIGQMFKQAARLFGTGAALMIENIDKIMLAVVALSIGQIPKLIMAMARLSTTIPGVSSAMAVANQRIIAVGVSSTRTGAAVAGMSRALGFLSGPVGGLITLLGSLGAAYVAMNRAQKSAMEDTRTSAERAMAAVKSAIESNMGLNRQQADQLKEDSKEMGSALSEQEKRLEKAAESAEHYRKQLEKDFDLTNVERSRFAMGLMVRVTERQLTEQEILNKVTREGNAQQIEMAKRLAETSASAKDAEGQIDLLGDRFLFLTEHARQAIGAMQEESPENIYEGFQKTLKGLSDEFLRNEQSIKGMQDSLRGANAGLKAAHDSGLATKKELDEMDRVIQNVTSSLVEATLELRGFTSNVTDLTTELSDAEVDLLNTKRILDGFGDDSDLIEIERDMRGLRETVKGLNEAELANLQRKLGLADDLTPDQVVEAYVRTRQAIAEANIELEKQIGFQEELDSHFESQKGSMDQLIGKYSDLMKASVERGEGAGSEQLEALRAQFDREKQMIEEHAAELSGGSFDIFSGEDIADQFEQRREILEEMYGFETERYNEHLAEMKENEKKAGLFQTIARGAQDAADVMGGAMEAMQMMGRDNSKAFQAIAIGEAVISQGLAIAKALGEGGPFAGPALAATMAAQTGAQIAQIKSQNFATGGYVSGPGTGTSDSIPANLSNGEFVMSAKAVRQIGLGRLNSMNQGARPTVGMSTGGLAGTSGSFSGDGGAVINLIDQRGSEAPAIERKESVDSEGRKQITMIVRDVVKREFAKGSMDETQQAVFGNRRKGKRR